MKWTKIIYTENQKMIGAVINHENYDPGIAPMSEKEQTSCNN